MCGNRLCRLRRFCFWQFIPLYSVVSGTLHVIKHGSPTEFRVRCIDLGFRRLSAAGRGRDTAIPSYFTGRGLDATRTGVKTPCGKRYEKGKQIQTKHRPGRLIVSPLFRSPKNGGGVGSGRRRSRHAVNPGRTIHDRSRPNGGFFCPRKRAPSLPPYPSVTRHL